MKSRRFGVRRRRRVRNHAWPTLCFLATFWTWWIKMSAFLRFYSLFGKSMVPLSSCFLLCGELVIFRDTALTSKSFNVLFNKVSDQFMYICALVTFEFESSSEDYPPVPYEF